MRGAQLVTDGLKAAAGISQQRLWDRLMAVGNVGALPGGGVCRHALSAEDIEARAMLLDFAAGCGFAVSVDRSANLWIRRAGEDPGVAPVVSGSHLDTQPAGGRFDGAYGVLAALEALTAIKEAGVRCRRPIDVVAWTNEEGGRFERGSLGASVWAGAASLDECVDDIGLDGVRLGSALDEVLGVAPGLPRRSDRWPAHAYIEAHIEQGPVLESRSVPIGVVTSIQGARWMNVTLQGRSGHAGTTPPSMRRDALQAASRAITALHDLMEDPEGRIRFTVGNGISHHPDEWASAEDCAAGARVLAAALVESANG